MKGLLIVVSAIVLSKSDVEKTQHIAALTDKIQKLENILYDMATAIPVGQGTQFLQNLRTFNQYLKEMVVLSNADKNSTKTALDLLITRGIPKFLDTPFTNGEKKRILDHYNWTLDDLDQLYADRVTAYTYWTDLLLIKNDNYLCDW